MKDLPYEVFLGTVVNTGWPIDGHRLYFALWDYDRRSSYHLYGWEDADDEAVMLTQFQTAVAAGFTEDNLEKFRAGWEAWQECPPGAFCIELDQLTDVEKVKPCGK